MVSVEDKLKKLGVIKATANQVADRFPNTCDRAFKNAKVVLPIQDNLTERLIKIKL